MKRLLFVLLICFCILPVHAKTVTISHQSKILYPGQSFTLSLQNTSSKTTISTSNKKIKTQRKTSTSFKITAKTTGQTTITLKSNKKTYKCTIITYKKPYKITIYRKDNYVCIYSKDKKGNYTKLTKHFVCSTGTDTPIGTYQTKNKYVWRLLYGGVYGQYATRITGPILFHSVPYYKQKKNTLEWQEYNKLGTKASLGCIRLEVKNAKWIYTNCPLKTSVTITDKRLPASIKKHGFTTIPSTSPNKGWDPTDPDKNNPWN